MLVGLMESRLLTRAHRRTSPGKRVRRRRDAFSLSLLPGPTHLSLGTRSERRERRELEAVRLAARRHASLVELGERRIEERLDVCEALIQLVALGAGHRDARELLRAA